MKTIILVIITILTIFNLFSCQSSNQEKREYSNTNLTSILNVCKGTPIVIAKSKEWDAYYKGGYKYKIIIKDDSLNYYEYIGTDYDIFTGDTIK